MTSWYQTAFGADYLKRYAHRDSREAEKAVRLFARSARLPQGSRVLDFCCGAGRHMAMFAEQGMDVFGMDLSADLLTEAARLFEEPPLVRADMRRIPFTEGAFDAVAHYFTAFGYFDGDAENLAVFSEIARILRHGGFYLFDFLSAPAVLRQFCDAPERETMEEVEENVRIETRRRILGDGVRVEKQVRWIENDQVKRTINESVRLFQPRELRSALECSGFECLQEWGSYDGEEYDEASSCRWIALSRKR